MTALKRGMIIDVDLELTKGSETGKFGPALLSPTASPSEQSLTVCKPVPWIIVLEWSESEAF
jgi:mRNA-degrading endonuclease toxin of MazEF toxin-antitoxin module